MLSENLDFFETNLETNFTYKKNSYRSGSNPGPKPVVQENHIYFILGQENFRTFKF